MIEALLEIIGTLLRLFAYRLLGTLLEKIFYWPGWLLLRLLTLGRYRPAQTTRHDRFAVALFAITMGVLFWLLYSDVWR